MKILITMYNINNPGGIINHNENLIAGLQQIGHEVDFVELVWRTSVKGKKTTDQNEYMTGASGIPVHQGKVGYSHKVNAIRTREIGTLLDGNALPMNLI